MAWELGFVKGLESNRAEVAKLLGLPRDAVEEDPSLDGEWRPVRIDIKGPITTKLTEQVLALVQNQIHEEGANFICLWIDSPAEGRRPTASTWRISWPASIPASSDLVPIPASG